MPLVYRPRSPLAQHVSLTREEAGRIAVSAPAWLWVEAGESVSSWYRDWDKHTRALPEAEAEDLVRRMTAALLVDSILEIAAHHRGCSGDDLRRCGWPLELVARLGPQASRTAAERRPDLARDLCAA